MTLTWFKVRTVEVAKAGLRVESINTKIPKAMNIDDVTKKSYAHLSDNFFKCKMWADKDMPGIF